MAASRLARGRGLDRRQTSARSEDDEGDPEKVGAEEVGHLHRRRREQKDVGHAEEVLQGEKRQNSEGQRPMGGNAQAADDKPEDEGAGNEADGGVQPANLEKPGAAGREILRDSAEEIVRGVERVTEGGERAGNADDEGCDEAGEGQTGRDNLDAAAHGTVATRKEVRGERQCCEEKKGIGEVKAEVNGAGW